MPSMSMNTATRMNGMPGWRRVAGIGPSSCPRRPGRRAPRRRRGRAGRRRRCSAPRPAPAISRRGPAASAWIRRCRSSQWQGTDLQSDSESTSPVLPSSSRAPTVVPGKTSAAGSARSTERDPVVRPRRRDAEQRRRPTARAATGPAPPARASTRPSARRAHRSASCTVSRGPPRPPLAGARRTATSGACRIFATNTS